MNNSRFEIVKIDINISTWNWWFSIRWMWSWKPWGHKSWLYGKTFLNFEWLCFGGHLEFGKILR